MCLFKPGGNLRGDADCFVDGHRSPGQSLRERFTRDSLEDQIRRLAESLEADALLLLTDVPAVMRSYGTPHAEPILRATPAALRRENFPAGSMGPKVQAVCRFVELTGDMAGIGALADAEQLLAGKTGTVITPGGDYGGPNDLKPPH